MTASEAIETIKVAIAEVEWDYPMEYSVAFEVAISALEKQIPKKPYKTKGPISQKQNDYYCSVCKRYLGDEMEVKHACLQPEYCQHCGQTLDWSDCNG